MADETLIDGRDTAGWKAQWDSLKQELDILNPKHDADVAKLEAAQAGQALAESEARQLGRRAENAEAALSAATEQVEAMRLANVSISGQLESANSTIAKLTAANQRHRENIAACAAAVAPLHKALGDSLAE